MPHPYQGPLAAQYADATWTADLSALRVRFTAALPARASGQPRILDLGVRIRAGRACVFSEAGFPVEAMYASPDMARIAAERTGLSVAVGRAEALVQDTPGLILEVTGASDDTRPEGAGLVWLNLLVRRSNEASALG